VRALCAIAAEDAIAYEAASVRVQEIREQAAYPGLRVNLRATLGNARCNVQLDVGFGDGVGAQALAGVDRMGQGGHLRSVGTVQLGHQFQNGAQFGRIGCQLLGRHLDAGQMRHLAHLVAAYRHPVPRRWL